LVQKLNLYSYPSIFTLIERDTNKWFEGFVRSQTLYINRSSKKENLDIYKMMLELKIPSILLPNISNFKVILGPLCWIFALLGYSKRVNNIMLTRNYKNGAINRKLFFYFYNLHLFKIHKNYKAYWKLGSVILQDKDYMLGVFCKTHPQWYKSMSLKDVIYRLNEVQKIVNSPQKDLNIIYKRVYIQKSQDPKDKRVRPLGVPSLSYRVYLSMLNNILTFIRVDSENVSEQHGYLPQKSILTAWKSIFNNIKNFQFIYEFDLKGFFDSVPLELIDKILKTEYGMPLKFRNKVLKLNLSKPVLTKVDRIYEPTRIYPLGFSRNINKLKNSLDKLGFKPSILEGLSEMQVKYSKE